ncbi:MAG TPA: SMI1/KNR4 family protein [Niastella sp.]
MSSINSVLEKVDQYLKTNRSEYYSILSPGLTDEGICELEEKYNIKLPADLRALYQWKNGHTEEHFLENFIDLNQFFSLEISLNTAQELTEMIGLDFTRGNWWNKNWIPILTADGDHYCYDLEGTFTGNKGQIIRSIHDDSWRPVVAPGLTAFLENILISWPNNICSGFNKGQVSMEHIAGYPLDFEAK